MLALRADGSMWAWGSNGDGQLGDGTTTNRSVTHVSALSGVVQVSGGSYFSLALKSDGTVWAMGRNQVGQLGNNTTVGSSVPVPVSGLANVTAIAAGAGHGLALKSDGTVWAWGANSAGQLGNGTTTDSSVPVQVSALIDVTAISAGGGHSLALKADGTVWSWGLNSKGQLGDGTFTFANRSIPAQVTGLSGVITRIAGGSEHSLALKSDGTVWAWGSDAYGQLGDGTLAPARPTPVQVLNLTNVIEIGAGVLHSLAIKSDGSVWAWGNNVDRQLGNGINPQLLQIGRASCRERV